MIVKRSRCDDYRRSHAATDAGIVYGRTYETGYYAALWAKIEKPLVERSLRALGGRHKKCLDFACGTGRITNVAAEYFAEVVGVDVSAPMLACASVPDNVRLRQIDITRESLGETFDVVTAFRFFLNAEPRLREEALQAIREHLNKDGRLVCNIQMNAISPIGIAARIANRLPLVKNAQHGEYCRTECIVGISGVHGRACHSVRISAAARQPAAKTLRGVD